MGERKCVDPLSFATCLRAVRVARVSLMSRHPPDEDPAMRAFACDHCGQLLFFENSHCLRCGAPLGFAPEKLELRTLEPLFRESYRAIDGSPHCRYRRCARAEVAACNWLVHESDPHELCVSCRLTSTVPALEDGHAQRAFALAEAAKRRLLYQLLDLGLPFVLRDDPPADGLRFVLAFGTPTRPVITGHANGVITLDLSESDHVHRERLRHEFGEPYRTLLGHFRHEIGHYYWSRLVRQEPRLTQFRELFGDERQDYGEALKRHYRGEARTYWADRFVSAYAAAHPWEDWAETFAHYLHVHDTMQTAASFGLRVSPAAPAVPPLGGKLAARASDDLDRSFADVIAEWLPLTYAFNAVNRSMGKEDLYPFVLAPTVIEKLSFVHDLVRAMVRAERERALSTATAA
jgi:hypothetical protein